MLIHIFTTGIIEPLEGIIHVIFEKQKKKTKLFFLMEKIIWFSLLLQPLIVCILFIILEMEPKFNKICILSNVAFYVYCTTVYKKVRLDIEIKQESGYTKLMWRNITGKGSRIFCLWEIAQCFIPCVILYNKSYIMKYFILLHVNIIMMSGMINLNNMHDGGPMWCFISSLGSWYMVLIQNINNCNL